KSCVGGRYLGYDASPRRTIDAREIARRSDLQRIRTSLGAIYGDRIERLVLFGSRARGDASEASDYDIAVFLQDLTDRWSEFHRLADLRTDILAETGAFLE